MTNSKSTKRALLMSAMSILICVSMLLGTTFAWFTDSVTSANNIIKSGNLDVEFEYWNKAENAWKTVKGSSNILTNDLWEPGVTEVAYLRVANKGSLALKYQLGVNIVSEKEGTNVAGDTFKLSDSLMFGMIEGKNGETDAFAKSDAGRAAAIASGKVNKIYVPYTKDSKIVAGGTEEYYALVVYMPTTVGNEANYKTSDESSIPDKYRPQIDLGINVVATQLENENDSFGNDYDEDAKLPVVVVNNVNELTSAVAAGGNIMLADDIELTKNLMPTKDVVIDLNGKTIKTTASNSLFQSQSNAAPSMIITSSTGGAVIDASNSTFNNGVVHSYGKTVIRNVTINAGSNKVVQVQGNGSVEIYDTVINTDSGNPFNVAGDFTLGKGTVVNVTNLNSNLINNNGAHAIVIDGAKINIATFKINGNSIIALNQASTLEMKNTSIKIDNFVLSPFGGDSLVSKVDGVTIEGCTFDVTDSNGKDCTFVAKDGKYRLVQN